jgi:DNA-binding beta-propeller fold protein YncE
MKSSITSNLRPLLRAFQAFLIAIAGLWPMPRNAHAQLYVIRGSKTGIVSEYDAKTGEVINANFITGLSRPVALAVNGNALFVTNFRSGTIGKYDATTGGAINASFITGLSEPFFLALLGNKLFVANFGSATVGEYDSKTGVAINASFITGLNNPVGLAVKIAK